MNTRESVRQTIERAGVKFPHNMLAMAEEIMAITHGGAPRVIQRQEIQEALEYVWAQGWTARDLNPPIGLFRAVR